MSLDRLIENTRKEMERRISLYGVLDFRTISKSKELDELIVKKQSQMSILI